MLHYKYYILQNHKAQSETLREREMNLFAEPKVLQRTIEECDSLRKCFFAFQFYKRINLSKQGK